MHSSFAADDRCSRTCFMIHGAATLSSAIMTEPALFFFPPCNSLLSIRPPMHACLLPFLPALRARPTRSHSVGMNAWRLPATCLIRSGSRQRERGTDQTCAILCLSVCPCRHVPVSVTPRHEGQPATCSIIRHAAHPSLCPGRTVKGPSPF